MVGRIGEAAARPCEFASASQSNPASEPGLFEVASDEPFLKERHAGSGVMPAPPNSLVVRDHCPMGSTHDSANTGSCSWEGEMTLLVVPDPCPRLRERLAAATADLAAVKAPDAGAPLPWLKVWREVANDKIAAVLSIERSLQMYGCESDEGANNDTMDLILRIARWYQQALVDFIGERRGRNEQIKDAIAEILATERQLQLLGMEGTGASGVVQEYLDERVSDLETKLDQGTITSAEKAELLGAYCTATLLGIGPADAAAGTQAYESGAPAPAATMTVSVHSPVSLHAYTPEGLHVGWNASANASESQVPFAAYEGAPGGRQRLTLPDGVWKVVEELAEGHYLLEVGWNGTDASGHDAHLVNATPGRETVSRYSLDVTPDGDARFLAFPIQRGPVGSFATFLPPSVEPSSTESGSPAPDAMGPQETPGTRETPSAGVLVALTTLAARAVRRRDVAL